MVPAFEGPSGNPEEQRDVIRLVVRHGEIGQPVLVEVRDGQAHRILAGGTGPRHIETAVTVAGQHEDALAAGNHEVEPPVAIQIVSLDRGGGASDSDVVLRRFVYERVNQGGAGFPDPDQPLIRWRTVFVPTLAIEPPKQLAIVLGLPERRMAQAR